MTEYPRSVVSQLALTDRLRRELQRRLALIYLGRPHSSSAVHEKVSRNLERAGPDCPQLTALRAAAQAARDGLVSGDFAALGAAMRANTVAQSELHADLVHEDARRVFSIAAAHGAAGWKVNGAGGDGGSITLLAGADPASKARHAARDRRGESGAGAAAYPVQSRGVASLVSNCRVGAAPIRRALRIEPTKALRQAG